MVVKGGGGDGGGGNNKKKYLVRELEMEEIGTSINVNSDIKMGERIIRCREFISLRDK